MATLEDDIELETPADELPLEEDTDELMEIEAELEESPLSYDEMEENLVPIFATTKKGQEFLKELSNQIVNEVTSALDDTEEYRARRAADWKLFSGDIPKKQAPFEHCANLHIPIVLENILLITSHSYSELFGNWNNVFGVVPMGDEDEQTAEILTIHGNWQIRQQIPGFKNQMYRGMLGFFMHGDITCHSFFDEVTGLNSHEILSPDDFVTPYTYTTTRPDYSDLPWYCKRLWRQKHELERMRDKWHDVQAVIDGNKASWDSDHEPHLAIAAASAFGIEAPEKDERAPFELYQYEGFLDLPEQTEQRFCQVIMEPKSKIIMALKIHEQENWQDRARFNMQLQERDQFLQQSQEHAAAEAERTAMMEQLTYQAAAGDMTSGVALEAYGAEPPLPPPPPPDWMRDPTNPMEEPERPRKEPIRLFVHGVNIEPLAGNLGLGHGRIQADFTRAANTMLNQFVDQATLSNAKTLMVTDSVEFERPFSVGPGKINKVRGLGPNLKDHIIPLDFGAGNPQLPEMADRMHQYGREAAQAPGVLAGETGKSGESAKLHQARLGQATKVLSVPTARYGGFFEEILKNNALLNSKFLRDEELFFIADPITKRMQQSKVRRDMYARNYQVEIRSDYTFEAKQARVMQADETLQMVSQHPITMNLANVQFYALKRCFEARGMHEVVAMLPPPPPAGIPMSVYVQMLGMPDPNAMAQMGLAPPPGGPGAPGGEQKGPPSNGAPAGAPAPENTAAPGAPPAPPPASN